MIRINLLPGARRQASASAGDLQVWVIAYSVAGVLAIAVLAFVYLAQRQTLDHQLAVNNDLSREIRELEGTSADIEEVRKQLERSRQLEAVVNELTRARYGPTAVLMELIRILSIDGGPTVAPERLEEIRQQNPLAVYNASWNPRRLWITELQEEDRVCTIRGAGKTNEDVAEFLRRLTLSERFERVELVKTEGAEDPSTRLPVINFHLTARVIY